MNNELSAPSSVDIPRWRLWLVVAAMAAMLIMLESKHLESVFDKLLFIAYVPIGVWIAFYGVFKSPQLQLLWGWMCLACGSLVVVLTVAALLRNAPLPKRELPVRLMLEIGVMLLNGYLLVFDRRIREYRHALRTRVGP
jgi:hypothetical protein